MKTLTYSRCHNVCYKGSEISMGLKSFKKGWQPQQSIDAFMAAKKRMFSWNLRQVYGERTAGIVDRVHKRY